MKYKKLVAPSLKEMFIDQMESLILSGELTVGEKLPPERELADSMGISRSVVNSGIVELERMGFLTIKPRSGTFVADYRRKGNLEMMKAILKLSHGHLSKAEIRSIFEVHSALDRLTMTRLIPRITEEDLQTLYLKLENIKKQKNANDTLVAGFEFHHELSVLSGNSLLSIIIPTYYLAVMDVWIRFYELNGAHLIYENSLHIWNALKDRNLQAALDWIETFTYEVTEGKYTIYF